MVEGWISCIARKFGIVAGRWIALVEGVGLVVIGGSDRHDSRIDKHRTQESPSVVCHPERRPAKQSVSSGVIVAVVKDRPECLSLSCTLQARHETLVKEPG